VTNLCAPNLSSRGGVEGSHESEAIAASLPDAHRAGYQHLDPTLRIAKRLQGLPRFFALLDQFPEFACLAELGVFGYRQFASEKEIAKRVLV
jgi:hypothetical protein